MDYQMMHTGRDILRCSMQSAAKMGCVGLWIVGRGMSTRASGSMARPTTHLVDVAANQQKWGYHRDIITNSGIFGCPAIPSGDFLAPFFMHMFRGEKNDEPLDSGLQFSDKPEQQPCPVLVSSTSFTLW